MTIRIKDVKEVEDLFIKELGSKGYQVVPIAQAMDTLNQQNYYLLDLFIYGYLSDYPSITLTIRKGNNIHYIANKFQMLFADHKDALITIARKMAKEIPETIQEELFYSPTIEQFIPKHARSIYAEVSSEISLEYAKKYQIDFTFANEQELDFVIVNQIKNYISLCVDFEGFRKQVKEKAIVVDFSIDKKGITKIEKMTIPEGVSEKQKEKISDLCEALPIWSIHANNAHTYRGTLRIGLKK